MPAPPAIKVERLVKLYKKVPAVDGISFSIAPGSITGLLGGNGAGKTTTISMIMGLLVPTSGRVTVLGADMPQQRYRVLQRMNFESPYVDMPMRLTVRQNLTIFGRLYAVANLRDRIEQLAADLDSIRARLDGLTHQVATAFKTQENELDAALAQLAAQARATAANPSPAQVDQLGVAVSVLKQLAPPLIAETRAECPNTAGGN